MSERSARLMVCTKESCVIYSPPSSSSEQTPSMVEALTDGAKLMINSSKP